jgi:hypothetical protein
VLTMALSDTDALSKIPGASLIDLTGERTRVV